MKENKYNSVSEFVTWYKPLNLCEEKLSFFEYMRRMIHLIIISRKTNFVKKLKTGFSFHCENDKNLCKFELMMVDNDYAYCGSYVLIFNDCTYEKHCYQDNSYENEVMKEMEKLVIDLIEYWKNEYGKKEISSNGQ